LNTRLSTLDSGIRVVTCEMPNSQTAALAIWASVGGRHEPARLSGISHFIEHMLFKGTSRRSARRISEEIEGVGGDLNAFTSEEQTCYHATASSDHFPRLCSVLADMYLDPRFAPADIERERQVIGEEILMGQDEPSQRVQELLWESLWPGHPLGRPVTGSLETVTRFTRGDFLDYRRAHYHAAATVVSAAGDVRHDDLVARVEKLLGDLPRGRKPAPRTAPSPRRKTPSVRVERKETNQTNVAIGLPSISLLDGRRHALSLLNIILGGNMSSRLFQELRERRGLCYSVSSHLSLYRDTGVLSISLGLEKSNLNRSLRLIGRELGRLRRDGVRPAELRRAKDYAIGSSRMAMERASSQNYRIGGGVLAYGEVQDIEESHARVRAVGAGDLLALAGEFLDPSTSTLVAVGPLDGPDGLAESLVGGAGDP